MELVNGALAGSAFTLAILCASIFVRRKDRSALVMALITLVLGVDALLGGTYLAVTLPVTAAALAAAWVMLRRQRKSHV